MFKSINLNATSNKNNWLDNSANRVDLLASFVSQEKEYFGIESSSAEVFLEDVG